MTTVPLRAAADPTAAAVTNVRPGDSGLLLAPAPIVVASISTAVTGTPTLTPAITPLTPVPAAAQGFVRDGGVLTVLFPAFQPPEAQATVTITIPVGPSGSAPVPVTCQVTVDPHFTLDSATGFNLTPASPLTLQSSDGTNIALVGSIAGVTATPNAAQITLTANPGAAPGPRTVLVADAANAQRLARRTITVGP